MPRPPSLVARSQRDHLARDQALGELATRAGGRGFAIAFDLLGSAAEAEDAVQEALARACARYQDLRDPGALTGWFVRVLVNHCLRILRRRRLFALVRPGRADGDEARAPEDEPAGAERAPGPAGAERAPGPDELLVRAASARRLCREVDRLPPMQKAVVVLRYGHDQSIEETAAGLGIGTASVKTHLRRALARLRRRLERP